MTEVVDATEIVEKMKNQKINYDSVLKKMIKQWGLAQKKPTILIHTCCAPCSTHTLEFMSEYAEVTLFFSNSNIHPKSEYLRRLAEQQRFVDEFNENTNHQVKLIVDEYRPSVFNKMVLENQLENEKEGGARCTACFNMRLDLVAQKAQELGYDYFGSALTISPKKNAALINQIGMDIQKYMAPIICLVISRKIRAMNARFRCVRNMISIVNVIVVVYFLPNNKGLT